MTRKIECIWYVEPLDSFTNNIIMRELEEIGGIIDTRRNSPCSDKKRHNLIQCPSFAFLKFLWESINDLHIKFNIFNQQGNGQIRPFSNGLFRKMMREPYKPKKQETSEKAQT
ncbi:MAG: hypothetical protein ABH956_03245 [Candidatus Nealsonbacteria bacterium]